MATLGNMAKLQLSSTRYHTAVTSDFYNDIFLLAPYAHHNGCSSCPNTYRCMANQR